MVLIWNKKWIRIILTHLKPQKLHNLLDLKILCQEIKRVALLLQGKLNHKSYHSKFKMKCKRKVRHPEQGKNYQNN